MTTEESDDAQTGSTPPDEENDRRRRSMKDEGEGQNNINQENEKSRLSNTTKTQSAKFVHTQAQVDAEMTTEESDDAQTGSTPPDEKNDRRRRSMKDEGEGQNTINQENEKSRLSNTTKTQSAKFVHTQAQVDAEMTTEESDDAQTGSTPPDEKNDRRRRSMKDEGEDQNNINQENEKSRLSNTTKTQSAKFVHTQAQVDAIANIMRFNIDKVMERDKTLNELVSRADNLDEAAGAFKNTAGKLKNTFFWKDFKMTLILIVVGVVVVLIVIVFLVFHFKH